MERLSDGVGPITAAAGPAQTPAAPGDATTSASTAPLGEQPIPYLKPIRAIAAKASIRGKRSREGALTSAPTADSSTRLILVNPRTSGVGRGWNYALPVWHAKTAA